MEKLRFFKCTAADGRAFHDGKTQYVPGERLEIKNPSPASAGACGRGLHLVSDIVNVKKYVNEDLRKCTFFLIEVDPTDVIASDSTKTRVQALTVVKELRESDIGIVRGRIDELVEHGSGSGYGYGYGYGSGSGSGDGSGYGYGYGSGSGSGDGYGYGYGSGSGSGDGSGYGYGYGSGSGDGYGLRV
jgi:hypothetical protein